MRVLLSAALIVAHCAALILWFYDTIRLDFYYILAGIILTSISFAAGHQVAKEKYEHQGVLDVQVRAFWRRIYAYRVAYHARDLPRPLPTKFRTHMRTALALLK